ncbi:MAG: hypothetical protein WDM90_15325 [Ferruginibacter sp.]
MKLAAQNKIVDDILIFREYTKLKSTYVDALPLMINKKNRPCTYILCASGCGYGKIEQQ